MENSEQKVETKDTIPARIKEHFFKDKNPPNLLKDYDVLGFDADHCLVKYNVKALIKLLISTGLEDMYEMGYPEDIQKFNYEEDLDMCMNATIFDLDNGTILKLLDNKEVGRAMKGYKILQKEEIQEIYGTPPIYHEFKWPNSYNLAADQTGNYWAFITYFDSAKVALVLNAINLKDKGLLPEKSYFDIAMDIRAIILKNYLHFNQHEVHKIEKYGKFFPEVLKDPKVYIQEQKEMRETLQRLRDSGKKLFLATNSHTEYTELIMKVTLGDDWAKFFDIICCYCRKPIFFLENKSAPFYALDDTKPHLKGKLIHNSDELELNGMYTEGNSQVLHGFFQRIMDKRDIKVAFFGDQYITDVYASSTNTNWDAFAVIEELTFYDDSYNEGVDPQLLKCDKYWGPEYFIESHDYGVSVKRNYFVGLLEQHARYALPLLKNMKLLMN